MTGAHTLWPARRVHMPAFFGALILAPFVGSALFFWLLIPVFALPFGLPFYLPLAGLFMLWRLGRGPITGWTGVGAGAIVNLIVFGAVLAYARLAQNRELDDMAGIFLIFGTPVAAIWGGIFARLNNGFAERPAKRPA
ncbi:MAG: hypothetical protein R3D85_09240 [Paracoccaceae bacterium]